MGRRLDDVQSEVGSTRQDEPLDPTRQLLHTDVAQQQQPVVREEPYLFEGVFSPAREEAPSIYEVFSKARGAHSIDALLAPDGPKAPLPRTIEPPIRCWVAISFARRDAPNYDGHESLQGRASLARGGRPIY